MTFFRNTPLAYWLLDPTGQIGTMYVTTILIVLVWLFYLHFSTESLKATAAEIARAKVEARVNHVLHDEDLDPQRPLFSPIRLFSNGSSPLPSSRYVESTPEEKTPIMRKLAPEGHRPTNAQLEVSPFRVAQPFGYRDSRPGTVGYTPIADRQPEAGLSRTGDPTVPGYQTPFTAKPGPIGLKAFSTRPQMPSNFSGPANDALVAFQTLQGNSMLNADGTPNKWSNLTGHFAELAREAPATFATLQKNGMLEADGTPTKKWEAEKRMPGHLSFGGKGKGKARDVVVHWENEGRKSGLAMLRRELEDEDFS